MATNLTKDINDITLNRGLPVIVFLGSLMFAGIIGNSLVLYIYLTRLKQNTIRCFIIGLTVVDLSICLFDIPFIIIDIRFQHTIGKFTTFCKVLHTVHDGLFLSAIFLIVTVAVERYNKVCRPFKKQMTVSAGRITTIVCYILSVALAIPACFVYGSTDEYIKESSVNGTRCDIVDDANPDFLLSRIVFWSVLDVLTVSILITLYCMIWCRVFRRLKCRNRGGTVILREIKTLNMSEDFKQQSGQAEDAPETGLTEPNPSRRTLETGGESRARVDFAADPPGNMTHSAKRPSAWDRGKAKSRELGVSRMTRTMFWVTVVTILSFLPVVIGMIAQMSGGETFKDFRNSLSWFYDVFTRSYYIQCVANPIIYSWFNTRFQYELKKIFHR